MSQTAPDNPAAGDVLAPMQAALEVIQSEHRTLAAVLHGLRFMVGEVRAGRAGADFELFRALLYYVDAYPERLHHPKEETALFARLRARTDAANPVLNELGREHQSGEASIRELERKLLAWEFAGRFEAFADAAEAYVEAYFQHMRKEEGTVLPLARQWLTADDWNEVSSAFSANVDPTRSDDAPVFRALFSRIVNLAPPPIGVGPLFPRR